MKRMFIVVVAVVTLLVAGGGWWWYTTTSPTGAATAEISASGSIEAEEVSITAEMGGRVREVLADEGDEVEKDAVLVRLDEALLVAQLEQARAAVKVAQANLAQVKAGTRPEEIAAAEAALAQAIATREGAKRAWENAQAVRDNPQELKAQIDQARTQVELAQTQVEQARIQIATAEVLRDQYRDDGSDQGKSLYRSYSKQVEAAQSGLLSAQAAAEGAQKSLKLLLAMRDNPLSLQAQVHAAQTQYELAASAVKVAQASLEVLKAGPTAEEVAVAGAQVQQAEAALGIIQAQRDKMTLRSPIAGLVTGRAIHVGETAAPGVSLMTVANLDEVKLTVYIPENHIGRVRLGQAVEVTVDSFPGRIFAGRVSYISSRAEFTPKNVQTQEERVKTVFAVKIRLSNPDHALKPGMPADAVIKGE